MATGSRLASRLIGTRIITGGEQTMNSLTLFTSRTHTQTQTRSQTHRHCLKRTVTRFQYGEQETLPLWFDLSRKKVWEKSTAAYLNILYTRKQRKTNDFNIFSSEFEDLVHFNLALLQEMTSWTTFKKETSCRFDFSFVLSDVWRGFCFFISYSVIFRTWPCLSFMKPFLFVRNNVSRELQKTRLQNIRFLQETICFPMLLLDTMSVCEMISNLQSFQSFMFLHCNHIYLNIFIHTHTYCKIYV